MNTRWKSIVAVAAVVVSFLILFWGVIATLVTDWSEDENYSHGFLIVPIALYFVWERRAVLQKLPAKGSVLGLVLIVGSVLVLAAGKFGADLFLTRVPLIGIVAGIVLYVWGWAHLRLLMLPILFLLLMIPIPALIFNQIAFPLQLVASRFGEVTLQAASIPVLREGNVITLANMQLEVAEACSGIRSLISLLTLGIVFGYFMHASLLVRWLLALSTIPVAIIANGFRVAGTGIAAHYYGPVAAQGFFHTFSGWLVFVVALVMLLVVHRAIVFFVPAPARAPGVAATV